MRKRYLSLNEVLLNWGKTGSNKGGKDRIIKSMDIYGSLTDMSIKCIFSSLPKGSKIINITAIERNLKIPPIVGKAELAATKKQIESVLDIYIDDEKIDLTKCVSRMGVLLTDEYKDSHEVIYIFKDSQAVYNCANLFKNCVRLTEVEKFIDISKLEEKIKGVVNFYGVFANCGILRSLCRIEGISLPQWLEIYQSLPAMAAKQIKTIENTGFISQYDELNHTK